MSWHKVNSASLCYSFLLWTDETKAQAAAQLCVFVFRFICFGQTRQRQQAAAFVEETGPEDMLEGVELMWIPYLR